MRKPLVRFARRLASWEPSTSDDELLDTELRRRDTGADDLQPSVYEVGPEEVVRALSEHATAFDPPTSCKGIDLRTTSREVRETPGDTGSSFTMSAHREIVLKDRKDLQALVREARASLPQRKYDVTRAEVCEYARGRLRSGDREWITACGQATAKKWLKKIAT